LIKNSKISKKSLGLPNIASLIWFILFFVRFVLALTQGRTRGDVHFTAAPVTPFLIENTTQKIFYFFVATRISRIYTRKYIMKTYVLKRFYHNRYFEMVQVKDRLQLRMKKFKVLKPKALEHEYVDVEFDYHDTLSEYKSRLKILKWVDDDSPKMRLGFIPLWAITSITGDPAKDGKLNINLYCGHLLILQNEDRACSVKLLMEFMAFQVKQQKQNRNSSSISQSLQAPIQRGVLKIQNTTGQFPSKSGLVQKVRA
jgi:hypothetical protein